MGGMAPALESARADRSDFFCTSKTFPKLPFPITFSSSKSSSDMCEGINELALIRGTAGAGAGAGVAGGGDEMGVVAGVVRLAESVGEGDAGGLVVLLGTNGANITPARGK